MLCVHCGQEHDPTQGSFCASCGLWVGQGGATPRRAARAAKAPPEVRCAECGVPTQGRLRCPACGARLQRAENELDPEERAEVEKRRRWRAAATAGAAAESATAGATPETGAAAAAEPAGVAPAGVAPRAVAEAGLAAAGPAEDVIMDLLPPEAEEAAPVAEDVPGATEAAPVIADEPAPGFADELVFPAVDFDEPPPR